MDPLPHTPPDAAWDDRLNRLVVTLCRPLRHRYRTRTHQLAAVTVEGGDVVTRLIESGAGVLITPNHCSHADPFTMYAAADHLRVPFHFMASTHLFTTGGPVRRWLLQHHGCFSVNRDGADLRAFRRAVSLLQRDRWPLVIFPEGEVYHLNDRVTPFRDGPAVIALTAARHTDRDVVVVPAAIRYTYAEDPTPALEAVMSELERRLNWRPRPADPLRERILRYATGQLALKELEYLGRITDGTIAERIARLREHVLDRLERSYGKDRSTFTVPERIKQIRRACLDRLHGDEAPSPEREREILIDLDDLFIVLKLFSYPGDYLTTEPTVERMAETIDKLEEDALGCPTAAIRGPRTALVRFGDPIRLHEFAAGCPRKAAPGLSARLEQSVQNLLDETRTP